MPTFPMLPKIDKDEKRFLSDESGAWKVETSADFLSRLVNSLAAGEFMADAGNIDSIPDVWAKPLLFKMTLFDMDSTKEFVAGLHNRVQNEWRALLAMIALKNVKQLNLRAEPVNLKEDDSDICRVLRSLVPKESINGEEDAWLTDIYVIYFNGKPIAMTSPVTLISVAADYDITFAGQLELPFSEDKSTLTDPIKFLAPDELAALKFWLDKLQESLKDLSKTLNDKAKESAHNILKCLDLYMTDVTQALRDAPSRPFKLILSNLNLDVGTARFLNNVVEGPKARISDSAVRLITDPARDKKNLLLLSPEMVRAFARQEGIDPARLVIWQGISANNITEKNLQGDKRKIGAITLSDEEKGDVEFRRPEDFFHEKIAVIEPGNVFTCSLKIAGASTLAGGAITPILPIKRELLKYFSPEEIATRISISEDRDNAIQIHFNFPLSGVNGKTTDYPFTKTYSANEVIYIQQNVPVIEMWPNFRRDGWKRYYLYYENYQGSTERDFNAETLADEMYYIEPYTYNKKLEKDFPAQGLKNRFTAKLDGFPESLVCHYRTTGNSTSEVGILLLQKPNIASARITGRKWKIGLDFGTSATMLYRNVGDGKPEPLNLEPHLLMITDSGGARSQTFENFIPSKMTDLSDGSFLSIFHLLGKNTRQRLRPLQDGHVLTDINLELLNKLGDLVDTNLKWKKEDAERAKTAAYISQVCLQALVEAVANGVENIQWNFSYPTAFSGEQKATFISNCTSGVKDAYLDSGLISEKDIDAYISENVEMWSESKASAYYFNKLNGGAANFAEGALCVDIGAGTTDISVISGQPGRIIYHTSVQYAGRYMFKPIYDNYKIFVPNYNADEINRVNQEKKNALIDKDMRNHSAEYIQDLGLNTGKESVQSVLQVTQFAVAGLFYYLGKLIGTLHDAGFYQEDHIPRVFVGGNGSRIFQWVTGGTAVDGSPFLNVFGKMLKDASRLKDNRKLRFTASRSPKVEVASGMISEKPLNDSEFFDEELIRTEMFGEGQSEIVYNAVLAGAEFVEDGKTQGASNFIGAYEISQGINVNSLKEFKKFIDCFNTSANLWDRGIPFDDEVADEIISNVNGIYVASKGGEVEKISVEPVFILELKQLLNMFEY